MNIGGKSSLLKVKINCGNMDCYVCQRPNTKYRCIKCEKRICNVCSVSSENEPGYNEEEYLVGICINCVESDSSVKQNEKVIEIASSSTHEAPKRKRQQTLMTFLSKNSSSSLSTVTSEVNIAKTTETKNTNVRKKSDEQKVRNLSKTTAEGWKHDSLLSYSAKEWLDINADKKGNVVSLRCKVCKTYSSSIESIKNFSRAWAGDGSTNLRHSNAEGHAKGEPHKKALELHWKCIGMCNEERAEKIRNDKKQELITTGIATMQDGEIDKTIKKFEIAYFIAKEELPLVKYPALLKLEEKHGVELGSNYRSDKQCATFIECIGEELGAQLRNKLSKANFFSVLTDGSTDVSIVEKEAVFVRYFDPSPPKQSTVRACHSFVSLADLESGKASGIVEAIQSSSSEIEAGDDLSKKFVAFGADGASVNQGELAGAIAALREAYGSWIIYIWCVSHRLELSLKDALKGTAFDDLDDMLLHIYYLYQKSPKKLRELREIHDAYKEVFEFEEGGVKPKRASGTRWIAHKLGALKLILDNTFNTSKK